MAELVDGNPLFPGDNEIDQLYKIQKSLGELIPEHGQTFANNKRFLGIKFPRITNLESLEMRFFGKTSPKGLSLLKALLKMNPSERPTAIEAIQHPYFDEVREDDFIKKLVSERHVKAESRKTSASSTANPQNKFWKSNRQTQYGAPYIKHIKILTGNKELEKEFKRMALKGTRYTRMDWHSS